MDHLKNAGTHLQCLSRGRKKEQREEQEQEEHQALLDEEFHCSQKGENKGCNVVVYKWVLTAALERDV